MSLPAGLGATLAGLPPGLAAVLFVLVYAAGTVVLIPKPVLNLAAGAWFGLAEGLGLAVAATTLGAVASLSLARGVLARGVLSRGVLSRGVLGRLKRGRLPGFLARRVGDGEQARERAAEWARKADRELREHGFRSVLALRLLPVLPFAVINYGCALGGTRLRPFAAATALGVLPGTAVLVLAGATASAPSPAGVWVSVAALALLGAVTLLPRLPAVGKRSTTSRGVEGVRTEVRR